ncbi:MAG: phosphodiesterase [Chloroflexota bacterium]
MKLIWLSDLHFVTPPATMFGFDPSAHITAAINYINQFHSDADYCIITGDLVDDGEKQSYLNLKSLLAPLTMPLFPIVGNHDNRAALREVFAPPITDQHDFVQYTVTTSEGLLIFLDTLIPNQSHGTLDAQRLQWLSQTLDQFPDQPTYLFMHHPPIDLGLGVLDEQNFDNKLAFSSLLKEHPHVRHLFAGHVHRPISASLSGIPISIMRSLLFQASLPYPPWDWDTFEPADEPPMLGIILMQQGNVVVHYHPLFR